MAPSVKTTQEWKMSILCIESKCTCMGLWLPISAPSPHLLQKPQPNPEPETGLVICIWNTHPAWSWMTSPRQSHPVQQPPAASPPNTPQHVNPYDQWHKTDLARVSLPRPGAKRHFGISLTFPWTNHSSRSQLPHHKDTHAGLREIHIGKKPRLLGQQRCCGLLLTHMLDICSPKIQHQKHSKTKNFLSNPTPPMENSTSDFI